MTNTSFDVYLADVQQYTTKHSREGDSTPSIDAAEQQLAKIMYQQRVGEDTPLSQKESEKELGKAYLEAEWVRGKASAEHAMRVFKNKVVATLDFHTPQSFTAII